VTRERSCVRGPEQARAEVVSRWGAVDAKVRPAGVSDCAEGMWAMSAEAARREVAGGWCERRAVGPSLCELSDCVCVERVCAVGPSARCGPKRGAA
jgi:hypothetical protein